MAAGLCYYGAANCINISDQEGLADVDSMVVRRMQERAGVATMDYSGA